MRQNTVAPTPPTPYNFQRYFRLDCVLRRILHIYWQFISMELTFECLGLGPVLF